MALPTVTIQLIPDIALAKFPLGTEIDFTATAEDPTGALIQHWVEIRNPAGVWTWGTDDGSAPGWDSDFPFDGSLAGTSSKSVKTGSMVLSTVGSWLLRSTATNVDPNANQWAVSNVIDITVFDPSTGSAVPAPDPSTVASVTIAGTKTPLTVGTKLNAGNVPLFTFDQPGDYEISVTSPPPVSTQPTVPVTPVTPPVDPITPPDDGGATGAVEPLWPMTPDAVSARLGPTWAQLNPNGGPEDRLTNNRPATQHSEIVDPRAKDYEYGTPSSTWNNFWSETVNFIKVKLGGGNGAGRIQPYAAYGGVAATRPRGDITGFDPDPVLGAAYATIPELGSVSQFTCGARSSLAMECNEALLGNLQGLIIPAGTQTSRGDVWPLPYTIVPGLAITAMALTSQNEVLIAVGFDPKSGAAKMAILACKAANLPSHTMKRFLQPNQASWTAWKLLGMIDLPFAGIPNAVAASSNGSWVGPSQTVWGEYDAQGQPVIGSDGQQVRDYLDLGQIDLSDPAKRAAMAFEGESDATPWGWVFATKGVVVVTCKASNQAAQYDLSGLMEFARKSYTEADQTKWQATCDAETAGNFPPTFALNASIAPTLVSVYSVNKPNGVALVQQLDRWSRDLWRAFIAREDGYCTILDVSPIMARYSWQLVGPGGILGEKFIAKNLTCVQFTRFNESGADKLMPPNQDGSVQTALGKVNCLMFGSRGERAIVFVQAWWQSLNEYDRITDVKMDDVTCLWPCERGSIIVAGGGTKIFTFIRGGVANDTGQTFAPDNFGRNWGPGGIEQEIDGFVPMLSGSNVN